MSKQENDFKVIVPAGAANVMPALDAFNAKLRGMVEKDSTSGAWIGLTAAIFSEKRITPEDDGTGLPFV